MNRPEILEIEGGEDADLAFRSARVGS